MTESKTGTEKFIIIDRLVFLSALLLTVVIATATTTHPYDKKSYLENPAELLSFENLLKDNPEVPVAGDIKEPSKEEPKAPAAQTEEKESEEKSEEKPEEKPEEEPRITNTPRNRSAAPAKENTPTKSEQPQPRKSNIDWSVVHVDDNGEYFDNNEPAPITPSTPEPEPQQPQELQQPQQPQEPAQQSAPETPASEPTETE